MRTNRRNFFQQVGAGIAGLELSTALPAGAATAAKNEVVKAKDTFADRVVGQGRRKQMWPIKNEMKSRRIKFDAPIDPISWAYMKELRENNKTKTIYPINPYVEVYQFRDNLYGLFTMNLDGGGDVWMFLTVGPEKAMLVDTAYGLGDLKGLVDQITGGKPLYVAVTHEHFDHAYGSCRFDKVYCHEYLAPLLEAQNEHIWDYLFDEYGDNIWVEFDRKDLPVFKKFEVAGVKDGYKFDLGGGYEIELMFQGGHSVGHAAYLDKQNRVVFTGDNIICDTSGCGSVAISGNLPGIVVSGAPGGAPFGGGGQNPNAQNTLLKNYGANLKRLIDRGDDFDFVYPAHFMVDVEKTVLQNELNAINELVANPEVYDYKNETWAKGGTPAARYVKHIKGFSVILYGYRRA